jgi:cytochrome c oxidase cbb3-type subunit 2
MPAYPWLLRPLSTERLGAELATLARLGVPYDPARIGNAARDALAQSRPDDDGAAAVAERYGEGVAIRAFDGDPSRLTEMDALVAYLQSLGTLTRAADRVQAEVRP